MSRILILDDDVHLALQWSRALEARGHNVLVTHGASDAYEAFEAHPVDLCVVDLLVRPEEQDNPDGGLVFLGRIPLHRRKGVKIIGVSGAIGGTFGIDARKLLMTFGADGFLQKPFLDAELVSDIEAILVA